MNAETFDGVVQNQITRSITVLTEKSKEYALGDDRLSHFKNTAVMQDSTAKQALWGMLSKHLTSISHMCRSDSNDVDLWDEKITDSINYLFLLRALIEEENTNAAD